MPSVITDKEDPQQAEGQGVLVCLLFFFLNFLKFYLFLERGEGREKERERNIDMWLPLACPQLGSKPATQACTLTGNRTGKSLVHRLALNPLSHTSQGFYMPSSCKLAIKSTGRNTNFSVNFSEFSKKCSERWKTMSAKEKSKFKDTANSDKAGYNREMKNYVPPKGNKKRKKKDPSAVGNCPAWFQKL